MTGDEGRVTGMAARRRTPAVLTALHTALRAKPPADADAATVALAKRYALELDDAALISKGTTKMLRKLEAAEVDPALLDELLVLATRIEEAYVAALIGPKLLAALESLQLSPKARTGVLQGAAPTDATPARSALDELRERRENRVAGADLVT